MSGYAHSIAYRMILDWASPESLAFDEDTALVEIRRICREQIAAERSSEAASTATGDES